MLNWFLTHPFVILGQRVLWGREKMPPQYLRMIYDTIYHIRHYMESPIWHPFFSIFFQLPWINILSQQNWITPDFPSASLLHSKLFSFPGSLNPSITWISKSSLIFSMRPFYNPMFVQSQMVDVGSFLWELQILPIGRLSPAWCFQEGKMTRTSSPPFSESELSLFAIDWGPSVLGSEFLSLRLYCLPIALCLYNLLLQFFCLAFQVPSEFGFHCWSAQNWSRSC